MAPTEAPPQEASKERFFRYFQLEVTGLFTPPLLDFHILTNSSPSRADVTPALHLPG